MAKKKLTYEEGIAELEALISGLEQGKMTLEESFKAFERAKTLEKALEVLLEEGDKKIRMLTEQGEEELTDAEVQS